MAKNRRRRPWYLLIMIIFWRLVCHIVDQVGRLLALALGALLIVIGLLLCLTIIGSIIGIPLIILGVLLIFCAMIRRRRPRR